MALLCLLLNDRNPKSIIALTVDHQLREASAAEAEQVAAWCQERGVQHVTLKWQHEKISSAIQAKARKARYDLMTQWCSENLIPVLLTAHTLEDQAETVAMRQQRTTSVKSLSGIWPETNWNGIQILRPLLNAQREDLRTYLKSIGQLWIEDPSNNDMRFERVRMRSLNPHTSLADVAAGAQAEIRASQKLVNHWCAENLSYDALGLATLPRLEFGHLPNLAKDSVIEKLCLNPTERAERQRLAAWLSLPENGRRTLGGMIFAKRKNHILVAREPKRISPTPVKLAANTPIVWDQRFFITSDIASTVVAAAYAKPLLKRNNIPAFVQQGLPVVMQNNAILAAPQILIHPSIKFEFSVK